MTTEIDAAIDRVRHAQIVSFGSAFQCTVVAISTDDRDLILAHVAARRELEEALERLIGHATLPGEPQLKGVEDALAQARAALSAPARKEPTHD